MQFKKFNGTTWETVQHKIYGGGTEQLASFPAMIQASGEALTDYTIYGNTGGVGERTENLLDYTTVRNAEYATATQITNGISISGRYYVRFRMVNPIIGQTYTMAWTAKTISGTVETGWRLQYSGNTYSSIALSGEPLAVEKEVSWLLLYVNTSSSEIGVVECTNIMLNTGSTAIPYEPYGYKIPVTSGGVTTNLYTYSPLGLTDSLTYTDTGIALPTVDGDNIISFGTTVQPSAMSATFKGWHPVQAAKQYDGNDWR